MRERKISKALAILLAISMFMQYMLIGVFADEEVVDGNTYTYTVTDGEAKITGCVLEDGVTDLDIPDTLGGAPVTCIGWAAFISKGLQSVTIPEHVIAIEGGAFEDNQLQSVTIPDSVLSIGWKAFENNQIDELNIGGGLQSIDNDAFYDNALTGLIIPANVTSIGASSFSSNQLTSVTIYNNNPGMTIGNNAFGVYGGVLTIYGYADSQAQTYAQSNSNNFMPLMSDLEVVQADADALSEEDITFGLDEDEVSVTQNFTLPLAGENDTIISWENTYGSDYISIDTDTGIVTVTRPAFGDGNAEVTLTATISKNDESETKDFTVTILEEEPVDDGGGEGEPDSLTDDYGNIYYYTANEDGENSITITGFELNGSTDLVIPETLNGLTVTRIADGSEVNTVFYNMGLTSVTLPDTLTYIGRNAFGRNKLSSVTIPASVVIIGGYAFARQGESKEKEDALAAINFAGGSYLETIGEGAFSENIIGSVTLPNSTKTIGLGAFFENVLEEAVIPASVESLSDYAFGGNRLTDVTIKNPDIYFGEDVFIENPEELTIHGYSGSTAEEYAAIKSHNFEALDVSGSGLLAHYSFENNLNDSSGNGNNGEVNGTVSYVDGYSGKALSLNGTNSVSLPYKLIYDNSKFTVAISFKTSDSGGLLGYQNMAEGTPGQFVPILSVRPDGTLFAELWIGESMVVTSGDKLVNDNKWHRVVMTSDDTQIIVYLDGENIGSAVGIPQHLSMYYNQIGTNAAWSREEYGFPNHVGTWNPFTGMIDEFEFYSDARTAEEISQNANLSALSLSKGSLSPDFAATTINYIATVASDIDSITVTPVAADVNSTLKVNGIETSSGEASLSINLEAGENEISVAVTAQDGTTKIYTITVNRQVDAPSTTYTVSYNGNGSTGGAIPTDGGSYIQGAAATVLGNTGSLTKEGYIFAGWNTQADGEGTAYAGDDTINMGASNVILYAVWDEVSAIPVAGSIVEFAGVDWVSLSDAAPYKLILKGLVQENGSTKTIQFSSENSNLFEGSTIDTYLNDTFLDSLGDEADKIDDSTWDFGQYYSESTMQVVRKVGMLTMRQFSANKSSGYPLDTIAPIFENWWLIDHSGGWNGASYILANELGKGFGNYKAPNQYLGIRPVVILKNDVTFEISGDHYTIPSTPPPGYNVAYNANGSTGGSVPIDINSYSEGNTVTVLVNAGSLTKTGYTFTGWNTAAAGSGTSYTAGSTFIMGNTNVTLYAMWTTSTPSVSDREDDDETAQSPAQPSAPASSNNSTSITLNDSTQISTAATTTQQTSNGQTTTTITIDEKKLSEILSKLPGAGANNSTAGQSSPVITIPAAAKSDVVVGQLTGQTVKEMESKAAVLEIRTEAATYTVPAQQIDISAVSQNMGQNVTLSDIKVQIEIAKPAEAIAKGVEDSANKGNFTIVAPPVEFNIKCTYGSKTVEVSQFNNYVERTVAIPAGVDLSKITTGVVVDPDGTVRHVPTRIIVINGKYYARINSLTNSTYSVIWNPIEFKDAANHWAKEAVNDMGSRMVISGVGDYMFGPDLEITRAEFAAIIVRALGLKPGSGEVPFTDVKGTDWYSGYVVTAAEHGLITGCGNGKFEPMDKITHEQAMTIIVRAMKLSGLKAGLASGEMEELLAGQLGADKAAAYAKESIAACIKLGIVTGRSGNAIAPEVNITRAEVAVLVKLLLQKSNLI